MQDATTSITCLVDDLPSESPATQGTKPTLTGSVAPTFARRFAAAFKPLVAPRRLLFLEGALGTGKTEVARALLHALSDAKLADERLADEDEGMLVPSPTFAILQPYETERCPVLHADLYRLQQQQTLDLGLEESLDKGFVMLEWGERLHPALKARLSRQAVLFRLRLAYASDSANASERSAVLTLPQRFATQNLHDLAKYDSGERQGSRKPSPRARSRPAVTRAFVLAAGLGTRMRGFTQKPKPLVRVGGKPLLLHAIERLQTQGVEQIFVNAHYRADAILKACENLSGVTVLREPMLLETGGGIERALPLLEDQPFFALNADALWHDPPAHRSPSLLACLEEGWQRLTQEKEKKEKEKEGEATALLALIEQQGARDVQARCPLLSDTSSSTSSSTSAVASSGAFCALEEGKPFPLVFPVPPCEHALYKHTKETHPAFRYIGVQVLTARAFRSLRTPCSIPASSMPASSMPISSSVPRPKPYSLTKLYAQEALTGGLFGLAVEQGRQRWRGRWLHVGERESLLKARRAWRRLSEQA